jgi:hypothetical protein
MIMVSPAFGQADAGDLIRNSIDDGGKLVAAYFGPLAKSVGAGLNTGWYNTGKPHRSGRFDLSLNFHLTFVPSDEREFDINELGMKSIQMANPTQSSITPALLGSSDPGPDLELRLTGLPGIGDTSLASFQAPPGVGINMMMLPSLKGAVGIYKQTEVMFRFVPSISLGSLDGSIGLWGVGLKHNVLQWFPGVVEKFPFDVSVMGAYSQFNFDVALDVQPEDVANLVLTGASYADQELAVQTSAFTANAIISKKMSVLTAYMGLGFESSKTTINMNGSYPVVGSVETNIASPDFGKGIVSDEVDPINEEIKGTNNVRLNLGMRLKFGVFTTTLDYTLAKYSTFLFGLGIAADWGD